MKGKQLASENYVATEATAISLLDNRDSENRANELSLLGRLTFLSVKSKTGVKQFTMQSAFALLETKTDWQTD